MSQESAKKFLEKLEADPKLAKELQGMTSNDSRVQKVKSLGFDFTKAEITEAAKSKKGLSQSDLDGIAGGGAANWVGATAGVAGAAASAI